MHDTTITSPDWTGHDRRVGERRTMSTFPADERRMGAERRTSIGITQPRDPALAVREHDPEPDATVALVGSAATDRRVMPGTEHDAIPSRAAIRGHPIHPMIVPLPIGALALTVLSDVAFAATRDRFFARASRALTGVGIASALGAAAFGALDFVGRRRIRDHRAAWLHAGGNLAAVGLSAASLAARLRTRDAVPPAALALSASVGTLLLITGWLGGELSYRHRIGVTRDTRGER